MELRKLSHLTGQTYAALAKVLKQSLELRHPNAVGAVAQEFRLLGKVLSLYNSLAETAMV